MSSTTSTPELWANFSLGLKNQNPKTYFSRSWTRHEGRFNDLKFHGPPSPAGQGLCDFNKAWSMVVKSRVKSLATPCVMELGQWKVGGYNRYFRSNFAKHAVVNLLTRDFTTMDHPLLKPHFLTVRGRRPMKSKKSLNLPYHTSIRPCYQTAWPNKTTSRFAHFGLDSQNDSPTRCCENKLFYLSDTKIESSRSKWNSLLLYKINSVHKYRG